MGTQEHTIHLETPETPDFGPQISDLRERLARLEERTENPHESPAVAESLSLASAAHQAAESLRERIAKLELESESAAHLASANDAAQRTAEQVAEVVPPAAIETPPLPPEAPTENREPHHPWWNPMRYV